MSLIQWTIFVFGSHLSRSTDTYVALTHGNPMQPFQQNFSFLKSDINQARNSSMLIIVKRKNRKYWKKLLLVHLILMLVLRNVIHTIISELQDNCSKISISFNVVRIFQVFLYPQTNVALAIFFFSASICIFSFACLNQLNKLHEKGEGRERKSWFS